MYTEEMLKHFSLNELFQLLAMKLDEFEKAQEKNDGYEICVRLREDLELIEGLIDEKRILEQLPSQNPS